MEVLNIMPENDSNQTLKKEEPPKQQDGLALIIGGLFVLALVFSAYNYFKNSRNETGTGLPQEDTDVQDITKGDVNGDAASDSKAEDTAVKEAKPISTQTTQEKISDTTSTVTWIANDYQNGDIKANSYSVKRGDTLWEIAEGAYGDGTQWVKILEANKSNIGFLANGQQALIVTGQTLIIP